MAENTIEQKPKRTRKPKEVVAPTVITPSEEVAQITSEEIAPKSEEIAPKEIASKEEITPKLEEVATPEITSLESTDEIVVEDRGEDALIAPKEEVKKEETSTEKILEDIEADAETKEEVVEKVISQNLAPKESKVVLKKLNPNLEDGKSKWAVAIVKGTELHVFFRGSLGKAHKRAENCCLLHGFDPKTIQFIRK